MPLPFITQQTGTVIANAGLTQTVTVNSSSTSTPGVPQQNGPGWASPTNTPTAATSTSSTTNWALYLVMLALAYFGFEWVKG